MSPASSSIDPEQKATEWKEQLECLWHTSVHWAHIDAVFWQVQAIFENNKRLHGGEPIFQDWMGQCYARSLSVGIRALVDGRRGTLSFKRLIADMKRHNERVLTRDRHVALYSQPYRGHQNFDRFAGEGAEFVRKRALQKWLDDLESLCEPITRYCNENVTHVALNPSEENLRYADLRIALRGVQKILGDCSLLLKASDLARMEPAIQGDWLVPFRTPWLSPQGELPPFKRLDEVELPGES